MILGFPLLICYSNSWIFFFLFNLALTHWTTLQYDFEGRKDLVKFVKTVADAGLYVHLRIGPYACAEWNYG